MGTEAVSACLVFILTALAAKHLLKIRVIAAILILLMVKQELLIVSWKSNLIMSSTKITLMSRIKQTLQYDPYVSVGLVTNSNTSKLCNSELFSP